MIAGQRYPLNKWTRSALVGCVVFVTGTATGQGEANQPGQQVFRADVSRVHIDVIVRDDRGFVDDLRLEDFRVFEDGRQVDVASLELIDVRSAESSTPKVVGDMTDDRLLRAEGPLETAHTVATTGGAIIFLVDGPSLSATTKQRFAAAWKQIVGAPESTDVPRAAYFLDSTNRLVELAPLSHDRALLVGAADRVAELPITSDDRNANLIGLVSTLPHPDPEFMGFFGRGESASALRAAIQEVKALEAAERTRAQAAYEILTAFCNALSVIDGRKAVVWVSEGVKLMRGGPYAAVLAAYQDIAERSPFHTPGVEAVAGIREIIRSLNDPDDVVLQQQRRLHETANNANVSIYAVDPTPLIEARMPGADVRVGPGGVREVLSNPFVIRGLDALGDSLRNAAAATGGRAFVHWTDFGAALQEIDADASVYYLLTYEPPRAAPDGAYHNVRVEVERPDVRVRFRAGYRHLAEAVRHERAGEVVRQLPGLALPAPADAQGGAPVAADSVAVPALADRPPEPLPENAVRLLASWVRWDAGRTSIAWGARVVNVTDVRVTVTLRIRFVDRDGTVLGSDSRMIEELRPGSGYAEKIVSNAGGALDAVHAGRVVVDYTALPPRR